MISANSFWILLAEVERAFEPKALEVRSLDLLSRSRSAAGADDEEDMIFVESVVDFTSFFSRNQKAASLFVSSQLIRNKNFSIASKSIGSSSMMFKFDSSRFSVFLTFRGQWRL